MEQKKVFEEISEKFPNLMKNINPQVNKTKKQKLKNKNKNQHPIRRNTLKPKIQSSPQKAARHKGTRMRNRADSPSERRQSRKL